MHLPTKFRHPTFNRSEVIVLTNKQKKVIWSVENVHLAALCYADGEEIEPVEFVLNLCQMLTNFYRATLC